MLCPCRFEILVECIWCRYLLSLCLLLFNRVLIVVIACHNLLLVIGTSNGDSNIVIGMVSVGVGDGIGDDLCWC